MIYKFYCGVLVRMHTFVLSALHVTNVCPVLDFTGISLTFKQELTTRPEHISSPPVFSGVRVFLCIFYLQIVICPFCHCVVFPLIYASEYPLRIFKLF